jgi:HAD superfamily hydrolase (TIGR01549 family)
MTPIPSTMARQPQRDVARGWLRNPAGQAERIAGILFDLDGTLYDQVRLRALMAVELLAAPLWLGPGARSRWRVLRAYRAAHERLRTSSSPEEPIATRQLREAAATGGVTEALAAAWVEEWMCQRPLKYLRYCRPRGLERLMTFLRERNVAVGVLSDYQPARKLAALALADHFDVVLCSTDPVVNRLKPHPRAFLHACAVMGLEPRSVLYVGDRPDVDAAGANAAGMPCVIIGRARGFVPTDGCVAYPSLEKLFHVLDDTR